MSPDIVTAGLSTVAVRMPAHPIAQALIRADWPSRCAPAPTGFTELSPTPRSCPRSLGSDVDLILEWRTLPDLASNPPSSSRRMLSPPFFARHHSTHGAGINHRSGRPRPRPSNRSPSRPGMRRRAITAHALPVLWPQTEHSRTWTGHLSAARARAQSHRRQRSHPPDAQSAPDYAAALYEVLHRADAGNYDWIAVDVPPAHPIGTPSRTD